MKKPRRLSLLILFIWLSLSLPTFAQADWFRSIRGKSDIESVSGDPNSSPYVELQKTISGATILQQKRLEDVNSEVHVAKPTAFQKRKSQATPFTHHPSSEKHKVTPVLFQRKRSQATPLIASKPSPLSGKLIGSLPLDPPPRSMLSLSTNRKNLESLTLAQLLIVTDIEGGIHALNRQNGEVLWSINNTNFPPLIKVTEPLHMANETLIVEPYGDGNLYYFSTYQGLQKLPVSIKQLINASPLDLKTHIVADGSGTIVEDEKIYTGSRKSAVYTIDALTGEIISAYGPGTENRSYKQSGANCTKTFQAEGCENVLVIGKTIYELSIHSKEGTIYNVTYATWQHNSVDNHLAIQNDNSQDGIYIAPFRDKSLLAIDSDFRIAKWVSLHFPGIINNVFDIFLDHKTSEKILLPHPLKAVDDFDEEIRVYLDQTENRSWFAMSSDYFPSLVDSAPTSKYSLSERWRIPTIFDNEELFKTAVTGVHSLHDLQFEEFFVNGEQYDSLSESNRLLLDSSPEEQLVKDSNKADRFSSNALEKYVSPEDVFAYKLKVQEELAREILKKNSNSITHAVARFIYRIVESGLILVFSFVVIVSLSKLKIIPPLHVLLEKSGVIPKQQLATTNVEIHEEPEEKKNPVVFSETITKHVKIVEPEGKAEEEKMEEPGREENSSEKKKRKRGNRGGKKNKKKVPQTENGLQDLKDFEFESELKHLTISEKVLGYGSSGTVVFQGSFQHRPVAVKRMLIDFYDVASHEINLLTESDDHPNVIRYYCSEITTRFLYIALELCTATLEDVIELKKDPHKYADLQKKADPVNILYQIGSGVAHLHSLKIVHRDLKPQNILIAPPKKYLHSNNVEQASLRVLISDFGLCKKLEADESSFRTNTINAAGTSGWRAPELLNESSSLFDSSDDQDSFNNTSTRTNGSSEPVVYDPITKQRLTRAIDIFSLGCVFYYVLSKGKHPFGERFLREGNIIRGECTFADLGKCLRERSLVVEAKDLISQMISQDPMKRPSATQILKHPLFWSIARKLEFLLKVSDRFEVERRDPPSPLLLKLEAVSKSVIPNRDWTVKFDKSFMDNLGKYRKYHGERLMDLLRAFRNKYHHFMDLPDDLAEMMGPIPEGFYFYFVRRFPNLLMEIYFVVNENLKDDQILNDFF